MLDSADLWLMGFGLSFFDNRAVQNGLGSPAPNAARGERDAQAVRTGAGNDPCSTAPSSTPTRGPQALTANLVDYHAPFGWLSARRRIGPVFARPVHAKPGSSIRCCRVSPLL
jgi:hypothetical protein